MKTIGQIIFTDDQAPGALRNGTEIVKITTEQHDTNPIGTRGKVLGSITDPTSHIYGYFIEWAHLPGVPFFVAGYKIAKLQ